MQQRADGEQHEAKPAHPPVLGVVASNPSAELASQLDLPSGMGLVVQQVLPNTTASSAGLKQYDVLQKIDDQLVINPEQVEVLIKKHKPGEQFTMTVIRHGKPKVLNAMIAKPHAQRQPGSANRPRRRPGQGMGPQGFGRFRNPPNHARPPEPGPTPDTSGAPGSPPPPPPPPHHHQPPPEEQGSTGAPAGQSTASMSELFRGLADLFAD